MQTTQRLIAAAESIERGIARLRIQLLRFGESMPGELYVHDPGTGEWRQSPRYKTHLATEEMRARLAEMARMGIPALIEYAKTPRPAA